jgi:hypothetical protein
MKISWAAAENPLIHDVDFHAHRGLALAIEPLRGLDHECGANSPTVKHALCGLRLDEHHRGYQNCLENTRHDDRLFTAVRE